VCICVRCLTGMDEEAYDQFPALRGRMNRRFDQRIDEARRVLWRAYQHGTLSEEELARTLDRLEFTPPTDPDVGERSERSNSERSNSERSNSERSNSERPN
jgi:hypothetical protein